MSGRLTTQGTWPSEVTIVRGWAKASVRQWNDDPGAGFVRLHRGTPDFLSAVTEMVRDFGGRSVYSPAMYRTSMRVWSRAGYEPHERLEIMERALTVKPVGPAAEVPFVHEPDWEEVHRVDSRAFDGFWRMSVDGLKEAASSTRTGGVLTVSDGTLLGYAIVAADTMTSYLQRIAVDPSASRRGIGTRLIRAALDWGRAQRVRSMLLNVRAGSGARDLYRREGFQATDTWLEILQA